jgi:hypothetical protein
MKNIRITKWEYKKLLNHIQKYEYIIHFNLGRALDRDIGECFYMPMISRHGTKGIVSPQLDFSFSPIVKLINNEYYESVYDIPNDYFKFSFAAQNKQELIMILNKRYKKSYKLQGGISNYGISCSLLKVLND